MYRQCQQHGVTADVVQKDPVIVFGTLSVHITLIVTKRNIYLMLLNSIQDTMS